MKGNSINRPSPAKVTRSHSEKAKPVLKKKGVHGSREIAGTETAEKLIPERALTPPFRSLKERKIKPESASSGVLLSALAAVVMPIVDKFIGLGATLIKKDFDKKVKFRAEALVRHQEEKVSVTESIKATSEKLKARREKLADMSEADCKEYLDLAYDQWDNLRERSQKKREIANCKEQLLALNHEKDETIAALSKTRPVLKPAAQSALKLVSGLRDVFSKKESKKNKDKVYQIDLGELQYPVPGQFDVRLSGLKISVQDLKKNEDGSLWLDVAEFSANLEVITVDGMKYGPVRVYGGFVLQIKKPFSDDLLKLMTCYSIRLPILAPGIIKKYTRALKIDEEGKDSKAAKPEKKPEDNPFSGITKLSDALDFQITAMNVETEDGVDHPLISRPGAEPVLQLLAPGLEAMRNLVDRTKLAEQESELQNLEVEINRRRRYLSDCEKLLKAMDEDARALTALYLKDRQAPNVKMGSHSAKIEATRHSFEVETHSYKNILRQREEALDSKRKAIEQLRHKESTEGEWLRFVTNIAQLALSTREAANSGKDKSGFSLAYSSGDRPTDDPLSETRPDRLAGLVNSTAYDDKKALHIHLSVSERQRSGSQSPASSSSGATDIELKFNPPAGELFHQLLITDFPLSLNDATELAELFSRMAPPGSDGGLQGGLSQIMEVRSSASLSSEQERGLVLDFLAGIGVNSKTATRLVPQLKQEVSKEKDVPQKPVQPVTAQPQPLPEETAAAGVNGFTLPPVEVVADKTGSDSPAESLHGLQAAASEPVSKEVTEGPELVATPAAKEEPKSWQESVREEALAAGIIDARPEKKPSLTAPVERESVSEEINNSNIPTDLESPTPDSGFSSERNSILGDYDTEEDLLDDDLPALENTSDESDLRPPVESLNSFKERPAEAVAIGIAPEPADVSDTPATEQQQKQLPALEDSLTEKPDTKPVEEPFSTVPPKGSVTYADQATQVNYADFADSAPHPKLLGQIYASPIAPETQRDPDSKKISNVAARKEASSLATPKQEPVKKLEKVGRLPIKQLKSMVEKTEQEIVGGQARARFTVQGSLAGVLGKLSWLTRLFTGSADLSIEVSVDVTHGIADLEHPVLYEKGRGFLRRFIINRLLRNAVRKQALNTVVDYRKPKPKIELAHESALAPLVTAGTGSD